MAELDPRGVHQDRVAAEDRGTTGAQAYVGGAELVDDGDRPGGHPRTERGLEQPRPLRAAGKEGRQVDLDAGWGVRGGDDAEPLSSVELVPAGHADDERETVGERRVEGLRAQVGRAAGEQVVVVRRGWVHRRPPVLQSRQATPATRRSCTIGKSLFCRSGRQRESSSSSTNSASQIAPGVATNRSCARALVGHRDPDEVVVVDERGVVVPERQPEGIGEPFHHHRLRGAVLADEQHRRLQRERGEHDLVELAPAEHAERPGRAQPRVARATRGLPLPDFVVRVAIGAPLVSSDP